MGRVIGRDRELRKIEGALSAARHGLAALVIEGEPGIGKTTVWRRTVELADEQGFRVLACRPVEPETKLAFTSLADLLSAVGSEVLAGLPGPQRAALEVALVRATPADGAVDARCVAAGFIAVLDRLAVAAPLLIAVDDAQWLDPASAGTLSFALRRLAAPRPIAVVVTTRVGAPDLIGASALAGPRGRLLLRPLTLSALFHAIQDELGLVFPRPILQRIFETSGGNPLFAIELARALEESGEKPALGEPLPLPGELQQLLEARVARLPAGARKSLLAVALLSTPTAGSVERALGDSAHAGLERALRARVIELRGDRIRFRHPLLAPAVTSSALPTTRRAMHRRLAEVVDNEEERARHLGLAVDGPDEMVATALEAAARVADDRGAPEHAVELLGLATRLTPADDVAAERRRRLELALAFARAGDQGEATRIADDLLLEEPTGPLRARALEFRAQIHWVDKTLAEAEACCEEALLHVGDDERLRARVLVTLARVSMRADEFHPRVRAALDNLESMDDPDPGLLSEALIARVGSDVSRGRGIPMDVVERGLELERIDPPRVVADRMSAALGTWLKYEGDFDGARNWLETTRRAALDEGDEGSLPYVLSHLPQLDLWTGDWTQSEARALEHLELAERTGQKGERLTALFNLAFVQAHMGRVHDTRARLTEALTGEDIAPWNEYQLLSALGFVELSTGSVSEAVASLSRAYEIYDDSGHGDTPAVFENYAEALVLAGDLATAEDVVALYESRARATRKAMTLAPALRCRALLLAARRQLDRATVALEEALVHHDAVDMPFSRARTLLLLGQVRRRRGKRRAAREALGEALAIFEELGAPLWAERALSELARVPSRRASGTALTPAEERVARLVAQGLTNEEAAQALFVTRKTIEANLTRIYRKLGVRSRATLISRWNEREGAEEAARL